MKRSKKKSNLEAIDAILDQFDFEMVRRTMMSMRWGWAPSNVVPDIREMRQTCRRILISLVEDPDLETICSGGFEAELVGDELELKFVLRQTAGKIIRDQKIRGLITRSRKRE